MDLLRDEFPQVQAILLPRNVGSAGGFARGMSAALAEGADWVWLMDDDVAPDASCLGELLDVAAATAKRVVVPRRLTPDGRDCANEAVLVESAHRLDVVIADPERERYRLIDLFTFEGPLIHRSVIEVVGLPNANLFIRGEDILYGVGITGATRAAGLRPGRPRDRGDAGCRCRKASRAPRASRAGSRATRLTRCSATGITGRPRTSSGIDT